MRLEPQKQVGKPFLGLPTFVFKNLDDLSGILGEPEHARELESLEHYSKRSSLCGTGPKPQVANQ
jgi:hypothetical protein